MALNCVQMPAFNFHLNSGYTLRQHLRYCFPDYSPSSVLQLSFDFPLVDAHFQESLLPHDLSGLYERLITTRFIAGPFRSEATLGNVEHDVGRARKQEN